jgi:hypothetical protein
LIVVELAAAQRIIMVGKGGGYDYSTLQAAIDAVANGDTVVVYPATYVENIRFRGKNINLATLPSRKAYALPAGVYAVGIILDPIHEILEQREEDNVAGLVQKKLYVGPRPTWVGEWSLYR